MDGLIAHLKLLHSEILISSFPKLVLAIVVAFALLYCTWRIISVRFSPLRKYPGPLLASKLIQGEFEHGYQVATDLTFLHLAEYTDLWRLYQVWTQKYQWNIKKLHEQYGPVVQIGPNLLDLDYPELIKTLYGTDGKWRKVRRGVSS